MYKSVNRWFYGPTPEEKVRAWQQRLRRESRQLDREMGRVRDNPNQPSPPAYTKAAHRMLILPIDLVCEYIRVPLGSFKWPQIIRRKS